MTIEDSTSQPMLRLRGVGKRYAQRWVLRNLDLELRRGELLALLGESGAGKSTLLNLIAGLEPANEGRIELDGVQVSADDDDASAALRRRSLGFVFQAFHLIPHMSAVRNVSIPLLLNGTAPVAALQAAARMLEQVGLGGRFESLPAQLSGGEQQRVALARALVHSPALLLADEPTGNLDPGSAQVALGLLASQVREHGAALLMVTHSEHAAAIADRRLRLDANGIQPC